MRGLMTTPQQEQAETADNRNINVSGGEYILDADTVRYLGLQKIQKLHEEAKQKMNSTVQGKNPEAKPKQPKMPPIKIPPMGGPQPMNNAMKAPPQPMGLGMPTGNQPKIPNQPPGPMQGLGQKPQTNFAQGGYVAPNVPKPVDFKEIQNYYSNMNKNSNVPKTQPYITSTGGLAYRYIDPKTNLPKETSPVKGSSTYDFSGMSPPRVDLPKGGGPSGGRDSDTTEDILKSAGAGIVVPAAAAALKAAGVGDWVKDGVKSLLGTGSTAGTTLVDSSLIPGGMASYTLPYAATESFMVPSAVETAGLPTYPTLDAWAAANPGTVAAESTLVPGGYLDIAPAASADVLGGSMGVDMLGAGGAAEAGVPVGLESLGGAEGFFAGTPFSATAGGVTGAIGGLTTALGYAAPMLVFAQLMKALNQSVDGPVTLGSGLTSLGEGFYNGSGPKAEEAANLGEAYRGDGGWYAGGDPSMVDDMNTAFGSRSQKKMIPYWSVGGAPYETPTLAVNSGRQIARQQMGLPVVEEDLSQYVIGNTLEHNLRYLENDPQNRRSLPVFDGAMQLPSDWDEWIDRANNSQYGWDGTGNSEAVAAWAPETIAAYRGNLDPRTQEWFDTRYTRNHMYGFTGQNSPDWELNDYSLVKKPSENN